MKKNLPHVLLLVLSAFLVACGSKSKPTADDILGNPAYPAISYGGYREATRKIVPTVEQLKEDMRILEAMGIKMLRTYNTQQYAHAANLLAAIRELKDEDPNFEMYVMLGTWIECKDAWTPEADHFAGDVENNTAEIEAAIAMANTYPDIVKVIAVGNEAMVQWAIKYFVHPNVILKWVNHLRSLRAEGGLPEGLWITSSDNYESWGGGSAVYHTDDLTALIEAVDFVSLHTYPFHDSHYNPAFWGVPEDEAGLTDLEKVHAAMERARDYAVAQYQAAADYIVGLGLEKEIHIGETGWATIAGSSYGPTGSQAADEYKEKLFYEAMREWTDNAGMSCFYFEAFDERWKDAANPLGSENHFGLINLKGEAKYVLWDEVDAGIFNRLTRDGVPITKTYGGDRDAMLADLLIPPLRSEMGILETTTINPLRAPGETVTESTFVIVKDLRNPTLEETETFPSASLKVNAWEGTCGIEMTPEGIIEIASGTGEWWGAALEVQGGIGENLSNFANGTLHFEIKGSTAARFNVGLQTGLFAAGDQINHFVAFGSAEKRVLTDQWQAHEVPMSELQKGGSFDNVTAPLYLHGIADLDGGNLYLRNVYYTRD